MENQQISEAGSKLSRNEIRSKVQKEAGLYASQNNRITLAISMGVGKTKIALEDMTRIKATDPKARFLVVIPRNPIEKTYHDEIAEWGFTSVDGDIDYVNYRSLHKLENLNEYTRIYLDEVHSLKFSHEIVLDNYFGPILGLTGTPPRYEKSEKGYMVNKFCPVGFTYLQGDAVDDKVLNDYKIYVHQLSLSEQKIHKISLKDGRSWYVSEVEDYTRQSDNVEMAEGFQEAQRHRIFRLSSMKKYPTKFNYLRDVLISRLNKSGFKFLVFCNTKDQADELAGEYGSYHSGNPDSAENMERFNEATSGYMTCVDQIKEGVTIPGLNTCVIMHSYGNERSASQKLGRILRLSPESTSYAHILMYADTVDQQWVTKALEDFDHEKIRLFDPEQNKATKFYG